MVETEAAEPAIPDSERGLSGTRARSEDALEELAARVLTAVTSIPPGIANGNAANGCTWFALVTAGLAIDTLVLVLVTPEGAEGLAFPPDRRFPTRLMLGGHPRTVRRHAMPGAGHCFSVPLTTSASSALTPDLARKIGRHVAEPFRAAVARARRSVLLHPSNQRPGPWRRAGGAPQ